MEYGDTDDTAHEVEVGQVLLEITMVVLVHKSWQQIEDSITDKAVDGLQSKSKMVNIKFDTKDYDNEFWSLTFT